MAGPEVDYDQLEAYFRALAYSSRLELLHLLRLPTPLSEIRLASRRDRPGENPGRAVARQTLQEHLDQLIDVGVVVVREPDGARGRKHFVVNGPRLYQIMEEFRKVGTVVVGPGAGRDETIAADAPRAGEAAPGPHLALVHGLYEGRSFPLRRADLEGGRGWVLGRKAGAHVCLEYDPYVSLENSEVVPNGAAFELMDLRGSKNGTWLNWRRLGRDERVALRPGDVIGVGRSHLVFRSE